MNKGGAIWFRSEQLGEALRTIYGVVRRTQRIALAPLVQCCAADREVSRPRWRRLDRLRTLLVEVGPDVRAAEAMWGSATSPGIARLRTAEGQLARRDGDLDAARTLLQQAVDLARTFGEAPAWWTL